MPLPFVHALKPALRRSRGTCAWCRLLLECDANVVPSSTEWEMALRPFYRCVSASADKLGGMASSPRVQVLVLRDSPSFVPIGIVDLLRKASMLPGLRRDVELTLVAPGASLHVAGAGGVTVRCDVRLADAGPCELVVVPPLDPDVVEHLAAHADV